MNKFVIYVYIYMKGMFEIIYTHNTSTCTNVIEYLGGPNYSSLISIWFKNLTKLDLELNLRGLVLEISLGGPHPLVLSF